MSVYRSFTVTLGAGEGVTIPVMARYYRVMQAASVPLIGVGSEDVFPLPPGIGVAVPSGFDRLRIENQSAAADTITIAVAEGRVDDSRFSLDTGAVVPVQSTKSTALATPLDVTLTALVATQIVPADSTRREVIVSNDSGGAIRVGGASVAAAAGLNVPAGGVVTLDTGAAVWGYSATGGPVSLMEVRD